MATLRINVPTDFSPVYFCPKCHHLYKTEQAARVCDASDVPPSVKVGEIVRVAIGYGWYDGDPKWLILNTGEFHGRKTHDAYFVVTHIDYDRGGHSPHEARVHIKTLGIKNGNPTGLKGYTYVGTHTALHPVEQDPILVAEGAKFIGEKAEHLI